MRRFLLAFFLVPAILLLAPACDDDGSEADKRGVGAECQTNDDCTEDNQECLLNFKGGYCGIKACTVDTDCPSGSGCVTHDDDGINYCFLVCTAKTECNVNRTGDNEANCSGSVTWADQDNGKACVPPSGN